MLLPALFWALWGAGWWLTAHASGSRWMKAVAVGSWLLALWSASVFELYAGSLVGLIVLMALPGALLRRESRRAAREA